MQGIHSFILLGLCVWTLPLLTECKAVESKTEADLLQLLQELVQEAKSQPQKKAVTCTGGLQARPDIIGTLRTPMELWHYGSYPPNKKCEWIIKAPEGQQVQLTFESFSLEGTGFFGNCPDYVKISDTDSTSLGTFCGEDTPGVINSSGGSLTVEFKSDGSEEKKGFVANYIAVGGSEEVHEACAGETQELTNTSGDISSLNYPRAYPGRAACSWRITVPEGKMVSLKFNHFSLEDSPNCAADHVRISETGSGQLLGTFCGDIVPDDISTDKGVLITFQSDKLIQKSGFYISYELQDLKVKGGVPHSDVECNFESDMCSWSQEDEDLWEVTDRLYDAETHASNSSLPVTDVNVGFPDKPRTGGKGDSFLLYDLLERGEIGTTAAIVSPELAATQPEGVCFKFYYFMGFYVKGTLKFIIRRRGLEDKLLLERFHAQGDDWHEAVVHVTNPYVFQLVIEASRGSVEMEGSIAIDDISVVPCPPDIMGLSNCGMFAPNKKRAFGGKDVLKGEWPFIVHMRLFHPGGGVSYCGGSIIHPLWILTAAHCYELGENKKVLNPWNAEYHLGEHGVSFLNDVWDASQRVVRAEKVFIHPKRPVWMSGEVGPNDIALVKLRHPLKLNDYIGVACLPEPDDEFSWGTDCVVAGWGYNPDNPDAQELKHLELDVMSNTECSIRTLGAHDIDNTMMCAIKRLSTASICPGDSGGPLMCESRGSFKLAGVVSWGISCDIQVIPFPSVFARVTTFLPWIKEVMENN